MCKPRGVDGEKIKQLREKQQLSQETLATKAGITRIHLGCVERGFSNTRLHTASAIANALGVQLEDILEDLPS